MRNGTQDIFESLLDDLTAQDNATDAAMAVATAPSDRVTLEDGQTRWRYRLKITKDNDNDLMYNTVRKQTSDDVENDLREMLDTVFASCRYVTDYEICRIDEPVTNYRHRSRIDVLFNSRKTTFSRMMRTLFIPVMRLQQEHMAYGFSFIDAFGLQEPMNFYNGMWFKYMYSAVTGSLSFDQDKGGVYYEWLKLYNIATRKTRVTGYHDDVFSAFFTLLLYTVYKTKWLKKFRTLKRDGDGYAVFDADVQVCDCNHEGHITGTVRLLAADSFTMATKMMILRVISK